MFKVHECNYRSVGFWARCIWSGLSIVFVIIIGAGKKCTYLLFGQSASVEAGADALRPEKTGISNKAVDKGFVGVGIENFNVNGRPDP